MRVTCGHLVGIILLVNTLLTLLVSITTPFWVADESSKSHYGLIAECADECDWYFEEDFGLWKRLPDWFKATQGLMVSGLATELIALIVAILSACTKCYSCSPHRLTAGFLLVSFVSTLVGIVVFCVKSNDEMNVELSKGSGLKFGWSMWLCVGSTALAFITSGIFACTSMKRTDDDYY